MDVVNSASRYRSGRGLAWTSIAITAVDAVLLLISTVAVAFYFAIVGGGSKETLVLYGSALIGLGGLHILLLIVGAVVFLMWLYRAYQNLLALGVKNLNYSPGWAIGCWFVPILNLFRPLQVVNEIWHGSDPENVKSEFNYGNTTSPALHGLWWALRIIGAVADRLLTMPGEHVNGLNEVSYTFTLLSTGGTFLSFVLLIVIIYRINQRQEIAGQNYDWRDVAPPPPPIFNEFPTQ